MAQHPNDLPTTPPADATKSAARQQTKQNAKRIRDLAEQLGADASKALLVIFQGMDASGKDGAVGAAFGRCSPMNIRAKSFKAPTRGERAHDFLWRVHPHAPALGEIAVWNRSHYEDVLIQRVHGWIDEATVDARFAAINAFERNLARDNATTIVKIFLHTSEEEQERQLRERLDEADKHYKHNPGDWEEREHWGAYMDAYADVLSRSEIPWHVCPTDKRWYRSLAASQTVRDALEAMELRWPGLPSG